MIGGFVSCGVLMALVWLFERGDNKPDTNDIITVVIFPLIVSALSRLTAFVFSPNIVSLIQLAAFIGATFYVLFKLLRIPMGRAIGYTAAVLLANVVASTVVAMLLK